MAWRILEPPQICTSLSNTDTIYMSFLYYIYNHESAGAGLLCDTVYLVY